MEVRHGGPAKRQDWKAACEKKGILRGKPATQEQYMKEAAQRLKATGRVVSYTMGYYTPCAQDADQEW